MAALKDGSGRVFIGRDKGVPVSELALMAVLRRMGRRADGARLPQSVPRLGGRKHALSQPRR